MRREATSIATRRRNTAPSGLAAAAVLREGDLITVSRGKAASEGGAAVVVKINESTGQVQVRYVLGTRKFWEPRDAILARPDVAAPSAGGRARRSRPMATATGRASPSDRDMDAQHDECTTRSGAGVASDVNSAKRSRLAFTPRPNSLARRGHAAAGADRQVARHQPRGKRGASGKADVQRPAKRAAMPLGAAGKEAARAYLAQLPAAEDGSSWWALFGGRNSKKTTPSWDAFCLMKPSPERTSLLMGWRVFKQSELVKKPEAAARKADRAAASQGSENGYKSGELRRKQQNESKTRRIASTRQTSVVAGMPSAVAQSPMPSLDAAPAPPPKTITRTYTKDYEKMVLKPTALKNKVRAVREQLIALGINCGPAIEMLLNSRDMKKFLPGANVDPAQQTMADAAMAGLPALFKVVSAAGGASRKGTADQRVARKIIAAVMAFGTDELHKAGTFNH